MNCFEQTLGFQDTHQPRSAALLGKPIVGGVAFQTGDQIPKSFQDPFNLVVP